MATRDYQDVFVNQKFLGRGAEKAEIKKLTAKNLSLIHISEPTRPY